MLDKEKFERYADNEIARWVVFLSLMPALLANT
jgi:hypothetical protein